MPKPEAWLLLGLVVTAAVLYTVGIVIGSALLIVIGMVVTIALYFLLRARSRRDS
jgi:hypothetical protein